MLARNNLLDTLINKTNKKKNLKKNKKENEKKMQLCSPRFMKTFQLSANSSYSTSKLLIIVK